MPIKVVETGNVKTITMYADALDDLTRIPTKQLDLWQKHNALMATVGNLTCFFTATAFPPTRAAMVAASLAISFGAVMAHEFITAHENIARDQQRITMRKDTVTISSTMNNAPPIELRTDQLIVRQIQIPDGEGSTKNCLNITAGENSINLGWFLKADDLNALQDHIQESLNRYRTTDNDFPHL